MGYRADLVRACVRGDLLAVQTQVARLNPRKSKTSRFLTDGFLAAVHARNFHVQDWLLAAGHVPLHAAEAAFVTACGRNDLGSVQFWAARKGEDGASWVDSALCTSGFQHAMSWMYGPPAWDVLKWLFVHRSSDLEESFFSRDYVFSRMVRRPADGDGEHVAGKLQFARWLLAQDPTWVPDSVAALQRLKVWSRGRQAWMASVVRVL